MIISTMTKCTQFFFMPLHNLSMRVLISSVQKSTKFIADISHSTEWNERCFWCLRVVSFHLYNELNGNKQKVALWSWQKLWMIEISTKKVTFDLRIMLLQKSFIQKAFHLRKMNEILWHWSKVLQLQFQWYGSMTHKNAYYL